MMSGPLTVLVQVPQLVQNPGVDVSELQLVPPNDLGQEVVPKNGNNNRSHSLSLPNTGSTASLCFLHLCLPRSQFAISLVPFVIEGSLLGSLD